MHCDGQKVLQYVEFVMYNYALYSVLNICLLIYLKDVNLSF